MRIIRTNILNPVSSSKTEFIKDAVICFDGNSIQTIESFSPTKHLHYEDRRSEVLCPGFIDVHVHLSQYRIRGLYKPALLPWLQESVFPEEIRSKDDLYAKTLTRDFYNALLRVGTTCSVIYTAPYKDACETSFLIADEMGIRAIIGMTMMDMNAPAEMISSTEECFRDSLSLFERWHSRSTLLDYIFTPRFAPTCSRELMTLTGKFAQKNGARIQTHLSENRDEITWVRDIFGSETYTQAYQDCGLLTPRTILAHAIHLDQDELRLIKDSGAGIAHCPDSNFYLKSGEFPLQEIKALNIPFSLGSDVGAGTSLSMPYHAKMFNFRQSVLPVEPSEAFHAITLGAAELLGLSDRIGSLQKGKQADLVFMKPTDGDFLDESILSRLVFYGHEYIVTETIVNGATLYRSHI